MLSRAESYASSFHQEWAAHGHDSFSHGHADPLVEVRLAVGDDDRVHLHVTSHHLSGAHASGANSSIPFVFFGKPDVPASSEQQSSSSVRRSAAVSDDDVLTTAAEDRAEDRQCDAASKAAGGGQKDQGDNSAAPQGKGILSMAWDWHGKLLRSSGLFGRRPAVKAGKGGGDGRGSDQQADQAAGGLQASGGKPEPGLSDEAIEHLASRFSTVIVMPVVTSQRSPPPAPGCNAPDAPAYPTESSKDMSAAMLMFTQPAGCEGDDAAGGASPVTPPRRLHARPTLIAPGEAPPAARNSLIDSLLSEVVHSATCVSGSLDVMDPAAAVPKVVPHACEDGGKGSSSLASEAAATAMESLSLQQPKALPPPIPTPASAEGGDGGAAGAAAVVTAPPPVPRLNLTLRTSTSGGDLPMPALESSDSPNMASTGEAALAAATSFSADSSETGPTAAPEQQAAACDAAGEAGQGMTSLQASDVEVAFDPASLDAAAQKAYRTVAYLVRKMLPEFVQGSASVSAAPSNAGGHMTARDLLYKSKQPGTTSSQGGEEGGPTQADGGVGDVLKEEGGRGSGVPQVDTQRAEAAGSEDDCVLEQGVGEGGEEAARSALADKREEDQRVLVLESAAGERTQSRTHPASPAATACAPVALLLSTNLPLPPLPITLTHPLRCVYPPLPCPPPPPACQGMVR